MRYSAIGLQVVALAAFVATASDTHAKFTPPSASMLVAGYFSATLKVGRVTGPDKPLAWHDSATINSKTTLTFQWTTTDSNVSARWSVMKSGTSTPIASGPIAQVPSPGKPGLFNINFGSFIPANAPSAGLNYDVIVSTYPRIRFGAVGRRLPPAQPVSTSPRVVVAYVRPGAPVRFDDDLGYSRRDIRIELHTLDVGDEDDPSSDDEPYAVVVGFKFRTLISSAGRASIQPGTLKVQRIGDSCHNNLGRGDDNWCDEDDDPYDIRSANLIVAESVPAGQVGWVVGMVVVMFEEDAFTRSTAVLMRDKIVEEARKAIETLNFSNVGTDQISSAVEKKIVGQIKGSFKYLAAGLPDFLSGLAQAADPDDIAGFNTAIAFTAPGGRLAATTGQPPANAQDIITQSVPVTSPLAFTLSYPAGDLSKAPGIARYQGQMSLRGTISTRLIR